MIRLSRPVAIGLGIIVTWTGAGRRAASPAAPADTRTAVGVDTVRLVLAATTDTHGRLRGWDYATDRADTSRSLAAAATIVDSLRAASPDRVVLVDAGDLLQGNALALVEGMHRPRSAPHGVIAAMNAMRYDAAAIGNHEFDFGVPRLDAAAREATFPLLAANAYRIDGARAFPAWRIVRRAGVRVGIVGATTPGSLVWNRDNLRGRIVLHDVVPEVRRAVDEVRSAGADVVVAVLHSGLDSPSSYDPAASSALRENAAASVAREVKGIDAIVFGHTHSEVADTVIGGTFLMQPRQHAASVGVAHLAVVRSGDGWRVASRRGEIVRTAGHAESPRVLAATRAAHERALRHARAAVASTPNAWRGDSARVADTPIVDFVLETMRRAAGADLAANAAFAVEASLGPGAVRQADLLRLYPYENTLRAVRVSGAQLRAFLEHSARYYRAWTAADTGRVVDPRVPGYNFDIVAGADYTLDVARPIGERVIRLTVGGRTVADADSFTLALNNYRQAGAGGYAMLAGAPVVYDRGERIADLLVAEARRRGTLRPADYFQRNWELVPAAAAAQAYAEMQPARPAQPPVGAAGQPVNKAQPAVAYRPARLRIIATNDVHGALEPRADAQGVVRGGLGPMAAVITRARAECAADCVSILLDGGDEFQGTPASNLAYGRPIVDAFRALDLSASALGNHEFDWTVDTLRARIRQAPYAILGANVRYSDGRRIPWLRADTIVVRRGFRIGIVGVASTETPTTTRAANVKGLRFDPPAPVVDEHARALRRRGAAVVVVVAHLGAFCDRAPAGSPPDAPNVCRGDIVDLANAVTEPIDAIVSGHTHSVVNAIVNGIPIVQARSTARAVGIIDLSLDADAPGPRIEVRDVVADSAGPTPPAIDAIVRRAVAAVGGRVNRRVAEIADDMPRERDEQYALGNLLADAQRWAGRGDVALMNNGGIRADLRRGTASYGSLFEIQPFGNTLYRVTVRGRDLRSYFERALDGAGRARVHVSGVTLTYDPSRPAGSRLLTLAMTDGKPVDDQRLYRMILNDFLVTGGDGVDLARSATSVTPLNVVDLDALIGYLRTLPSPVRAPDEERIRAVEAPR